MKTQPKLIIGVCVITAATVYMGYLGASASWKYYLTSDECFARATELVGSRIRVSGKVASGSLRETGGSEQVSFALESTSGQLNVVASEPLPDNFSEGIDVVVEGRLESPDLLRGEKILTRCASKYESQDAAQSEKTVARTARNGR